jgi:hypothetical protein
MAKEIQDEGLGAEAGSQTEGIDESGVQMTIGNDIVVITTVIVDTHHANEQGVIGTVLDASRDPELIAEAATCLRGLAIGVDLRINEDMIAVGIMDNEIDR